MDRPTGTALLDHFAALEDPRQVAKVLYYCCVTGHTKSLIQLPFLSRTSARIVERGQWVSPARDTAVLRGRLRSQRGSGEPGHKGARSAVQEGATLPGGTPCGQRRAGPMSATSAPGRP